MSKTFVREVSKVTMVAMIAVALIVNGTPSQADQVRLNVALGTPVLRAGTPQRTFLKVGLTGFPMAGEAVRAPANVAIVLDKSGSMGGEKIQQARLSAIDAVERLQAQDVVSVVAYSDTVEVVVPARPAAEKAAIIEGIRGIRAGGGTALFAGVSKGAAEVRKYLDRERINRVVLLSDGQANVGPSSPTELGQLGVSLIREGISVTTLGLGLDYNEDLMTTLAATSDGNHAFIQTATDLAHFFELEFGLGLAVVAQEVRVRIDCADGVRPLRVLGREGQIRGQQVIVPINQLYADQERYVMVEVEVAPGVDGMTRDVAEVAVSYANLKTKTTDRLQSALAARFAASEEVVKKETNEAVMVAAVAQVANEQNRLAVRLRDSGEVAKAQALLKRNAGYLRENAARYRDEDLMRQSEDNAIDAEAVVDEKQFKARRKDMQDRSLDVEVQTAF